MKQMKIVLTKLELADRAIAEGMCTVDGRPPDNLPLFSVPLKSSLQTYACRLRTRISDSQACLSTGPYTSKPNPR